MTFLPQTTTLPAGPLRRTHAPRAGPYSSYRNCCRWDFGFTCVLCFLHESDLIEGGAEGTALVWIEHHELKSVEPERRDDYTNCLLSCRFCNNGRSSMPNEDPESGAVLLDPTCVSWSERFAINDAFVMRPKESLDPDATWTNTSYVLDSPRKAALRENRFVRFANLRRAEGEVSAQVPRLLEEAYAEEDVEQKAWLLSLARGVIESYNAAYREILRYEAIPSDAPGSCRCDAPRQLPDWLRQQLQSVAGLNAEVG